MKIHLPNSAFLGNIDAFIRSFDPANPDALEVTFNEKWVSLHPLVLSMTASLGLLAKQNNSSIACRIPEATSKHYLDVMGLNKFLPLPGTTIVKHEPAGRFIPLTQITNSRQLTDFITEMVPLLHTTPEQAEPIKYVISELARNVLEHASSPTGAIVCAQFFAKSNRISIGVADIGVGIKNTIKMAQPVSDDISAIELALTPGVTGTTSRLGGTESNAGAGLFFIKSIAKVNRDFFVLYSGTGMYKLLKTPLGHKIKLNANPQLDKSTRKNDFPYWKGTSVGIDISLDSNEKFDKLLDLIRDVYRIDIRNKKKDKFKRARFI